MNFYPKIDYADDVVFATDPNATALQWCAAKVRVPKTESADLIVFGSQGIEYRRDCLYVTDPKCKNTRLWAEPGRGVFKLAPREEQIRQDRLDRAEDRLRMDAIETKQMLIERTLEGSVASAQRAKSRPVNS